MNFIKKTFVALLICIFCFSGNCITTNANESVDDDLELILIKEQSSDVTRTTSRGYTHYYQYIIPGTSQVVCKFSMTVGFNYDYDDGMARITSLTYNVSYLAPGFTIGNFNKSISSPGNPAKATLTYTIYYNNVYQGKGTCEARCYNTGNISWY